MTDKLYEFTKFKLLFFIVEFKIPIEIPLYLPYQI